MGRCFSFKDDRSKHRVSHEYIIDESFPSVIPIATFIFEIIWRVPMAKKI